MLDHYRAHTGLLSIVDCATTEHTHKHSSKWHNYRIHILILLIIVDSATTVHTNAYLILDNATTHAQLNRTCVFLTCFYVSQVVLDVPVFVSEVSEQLTRLCNLIYDHICIQCHHQDVFLSGHQHECLKKFLVKSRLFMYFNVEKLHSQTTWVTERVSKNLYPRPMMW